MILINLKCKKMCQYEYFHRDWAQRIYEVRGSQNDLWKQVYLAALPSKFVEYIQQQEVFQTSFENYTWGEIYCNITKALVGLCTSMKVNKSLQKMSRLPNNKSICNKYGLIIDDPIVQIRKHRKSQNKGHKQSAKNHPHKSNRHKKGSYKIVPRTHYYEPKDIHLKSQRKNMITYWLCGQTGHTANKCPQGRESRENRGKKHKNVPLKDLESTSRKKYT